MSKKAKAAICRETNQPLVVEEVTIESPLRHEVMIAVKACGVCHSDLNIIHGNPMIPPPIVLGHEAAGIVKVVGEGVTSLAPGDHVLVSWAPNCGKCKFCQMGKQSICEQFANTLYTLRDGRKPVTDKNGNSIGVFLGVGLLAEYAIIHERCAIKIDQSIPFDKASLIGCAVMSGVGAVINTAKIEVGSTVAVFGAGGVGLNAVQGAVLSSASKIIAIDLSDEKLAFAKKMGATHLLNAGSEKDVIASIHELTEGGVDYAFECIGRPEVITQAYASIRPGGMAVVVGLTKATDEVTIPSFMIPLEEKCLKGSYYGSAIPSIDFPKLLTLYQTGRLKLNELVSKTYSLNEVNEAFADLKAGKNIRGVVLFD